MEEMWPIVVPPLMTLLDDHETRYRSEGVRCLSVLLDRVSGSLLKKTGLSNLIQNVSWTTCREGVVLAEFLSVYWMTPVYYCDI